jgi:PAT family beta-lactamase induction signal transducer AmpG
MVAALNVPNLAYTAMACFQPESPWWICTAVGLEQFGYGFGFTAYLLYCMYVSQGRHETVHYALCTGLMAVGMMLPGMFSGWLQELIGYRSFFVWILLSTIPSFAVTLLIPLDAEFGKKSNA